MTLGELMNIRGIRYNSIFGHRAEDIDFDNPERIFYCLGYIVNHCRRFEFEIPEERTQTYGSYPIANGLTSGGHTMKQSNQYRIYFDTLNNMPPELRSRLQHDNNKRITGSRFIEACYYLGFVAGSYQDSRNILMNIQSIVNTPSENQALGLGLRL
ncbi:MAG: hypothetical protein K5669_08795 [Lachnospiraceae bacterium]|nr:hypothetical protein [Lachnospiraceae bacterium]